MEILNKDDEIERLVVTTGFDITDITLQIVVQRDAQADLPYEDSVSSVGSKLWCRESDHVSSLSLSSLRWQSRWFAILSKQTAGEKRACVQ